MCIYIAEGDVVLEPVNEDVDPMKMFVAKVAGIEKMRGGKQKAASSAERGSMEKAIGCCSTKVCRSFGRGNNISGVVDVGHIHGCYYSKANNPFIQNHRFPLPC